MILRYAIVLAVVVILALFARWAFLPARHLPGNRARHLRLRLHLRLHPGKGFAPAFTLCAAVRARLAGAFRAARPDSAPPSRPRVPPRPRARPSVLLGPGAAPGARLQIPLGARSRDRAAKACSVRRPRSPVSRPALPRPVIAATPWPSQDVKLTAPVRSLREPVHVFDPQGISSVPSTFCSSPGEGSEGTATRVRARGFVRVAVSQKGVGGGTVPRKATKTARFLDLAAERHGPLASIPLSRVAAISAALAPQVALNPGAARAALRKAILAAQNGDSR